MEIYTKEMVKNIKVIEKLLITLEKDLKFLSVNNNIKNTKDLTVRVNKITTILKNTLDLERGGQIAKHLMHLYNHIQYASVRAHDHKDFSAINSAYKVVKEINEGWTKLAKEVAA
tara:strand:+ start:532 stop:876 length:345 start_codon:yes stop_codon:yes gene_type:complete